ncbi:MAG: hypothetical protein ACREQX_11770 [Candidatus Binataceae bacterium]
MDHTLRELRLPSGKTAKIRKGKGRDLMRAHRATAGNEEPLALIFALVAELTEIEGKPVVYEDLLEMTLEDVLTLQEEVLGGGPATTNFQDPPRAGGAPAADTASPPLARCWS